MSFYLYLDITPYLNFFQTKEDLLIWQMKFMAQANILYRSYISLDYTFYMFLFKVFAMLFKY